MLLPVAFSNRMKSDSPLAARIVLGIVAAMAMSIPVAINMKEEHDLALLQKTAQVADGRVTKIHCENHGRLAYSYIVNGHVHGGAGTLVGKSCADVRIGDEIKIIYSAEKPQLSRCDSLESWQGMIHGNFFALALISLAGVIVIFRITRIDVER